MQMTEKRSPLPSAEDGEGTLEGMAAMLAPQGGGRVKNRNACDTCEHLEQTGLEADFLLFPLCEIVYSLLGISHFSRVFCRVITGS